ncbi:MAG TPA: DUF1178 family protein [Alphaproteobacteria bacterium]
MIVYNLRCPDEHLFEAWFRDSAGFDEQVRAGAVACPTCASTDIAKAPMAPNITSRRDAPAKREVPAEVLVKLKQLRAEVEHNSEHVGPRFPEEARKIHYGETEPRNIHGDATADEARALSDEGIEFAVIPWVTRTDS